MAGYGERYRNSVGKREMLPAERQQEMKRKKGAKQKG